MKIYPLFPEQNFPSISNKRRNVP
ncbi:hypothetical protein M6B38_323600 [Iris pallida]|uniref:Uncharacterized protein n=1 Tax=Iris pallida TaxID=29817 RepID=A0AAX6HBB8_IRIPA|nr:hypothetical protein M6B38_397745 [Iris pallida]KAJ6837897.1 hypothetical protein M6B38_323600 [Iris pallida]